MAVGAPPVVFLKSPPGASSDLDGTADCTIGGVALPGANFSIRVLVAVPSWRSLDLGRFGLMATLLALHLRDLQRSRELSVVEAGVSSFTASCSLLAF